MKGTETMKLRTVITVSMLGLGVVTLSACDRKDDTPLERASESVQDGLNIRENEALKDAGEDVQSAIENTGEAIENKANELDRRAEEMRD